MSKRVWLFAPLAIFVVLAGFLYRGLSLDPNAMPSALIDQPLPQFSLPKLLEPQTLVTTKDLHGEVMLLNVWATWCISCRQEHPQLNAIAQREGIKIVGVNYKDDPVEARSWLARYGNPYRMTIVDEDGLLGIDLGVFGAPETYVIDKQGIIRYKYVGVIDSIVWQETIRPIVKAL